MSAASGEEKSGIDRESALLEWTTSHCQDGRDIDMDLSWNMIQENGLDVITAVLNDFLLNRVKKDMYKECRPFGTRGYMSLYTIALRIVESNPTNGSHSPGSECCDRILTFIQSYLSSPAISALLDGREFSLSEFITVWKSHQLLTKWLIKIFWHYEKWIQSLPVENSGLGAAALLAFYDLMYIRHREQTVRMALHMIRQEREGELIDTSILQEFTHLLLTMGFTADALRSDGHFEEIKKMSFEMKLKNTEYKSIYQADFERAFIEETKIYYREKSISWIHENDVMKYIEQIDTAVQLEEQRASAYLECTTRVKIVKVVLVELLCGQDGIIFDAVKRMLDEIYGYTQVCRNLIDPTVVDIYDKILTNVYMSLLHRTKLLNYLMGKHWIRFNYCTVFVSVLKHFLPIPLVSS